MNLKKLLLAALAPAFLASCQHSGDPYMTLATKTLSAEAEGGTLTVDLASNVYYRVNNDCKDDDGVFWAEIKSAGTSGDITTFSIEVTPNTGSKERTGTIRFIGDDVTPLKLTVNQKRVIPKGIDPVSSSVAATATEATFSVFGDKEWNAVCSDPDVTILPASGLGDCDIKITFPENRKLSARTIKVDVIIKDDATYTYMLVQAPYRGVLADWNLNAIIDSSAATFTDDSEQTEFPGTNGKYVLPSEGSGKIEYWACDRTGWNKAAKNGVTCKRAVGGNGDPYISGTVPGDYWYISGDMNGETIPAGTKVHFYFVTKLGTACSNYWMVEFKDGDVWSPALGTSTVTESSVKGLSGAAYEYSATITYNFAGMLLDTSKNGAYIAVEGTFTTTKDMTEVIVRFGEAGRVALSGAKFDGKYIDEVSTSCQSRLSAQHPSNPETGAAVKEYNQHVLLEIVD